MEKTVIMGGRPIRYTLRVSLRARHLRLSIHEGGEVRLTVPKRYRPEQAERFLYDKAEWILRHVDRFARIPGRVRLPTGRLNFMRHKAAARRLVMQLIEELNTVYNVRFKRVTVRDQKTRWGSCSRDGRLSFSYKIVFVAPEMARYVVAHELAHLKEFNHSARFWAWVGQTVPDYKAQRKALRAWSLR